jgi:hypothetical protein
VKPFRSALLAAIAFAAVSGFAVQANAASLCDGIAGNLVLNCGFETGSLSHWSIVNEVTHIANADPIRVHSGDYGFAASDALLKQSIATVAGASYEVTVWYRSIGQFPSDFSVTFDGVTGFSLSDPPDADWTAYRFNVVAGGVAALLQIGARQDTSYAGIDDISVVAIAAEPTSLAVLSAGLAGMGLVLLVRPHKGG